MVDAWRRLNSTSNVFIRTLDDGDTEYFWERPNALGTEKTRIIQKVKKSFLDSVEREIREDGPRRVVISADSIVTGLVATPGTAANQQVIYRVIFIRRDRYSLASPLRYWAAAEKTWTNNWVGIMVQTPLGPWKCYPYYAYKELRGLSKFIAEARDCFEDDDEDLLAEQLSLFATSMLDERL